MDKSLFIQLRTKLVSEMLDNPKDGIYETTKLFSKLDDIFDILTEYRYPKSEAQELVNPTEYRKCFVIINNEVRHMKINKRCIIIKNGLEYYNDDYGNGACHWSIIKTKEEAYDRQMKENVLWAIDRLPWAQKHSPEEVPKLIETIKTDGKSLTPEYYKKLKINSEEV